jgi:hypothetical protein
MIGTEGAKTRSKMQITHFLLRYSFREAYSTSCGRKGTVGDPTGAYSAEEIGKRGDCHSDKRSSKMQKTHFLRAMFMLPKHTLVVGLKQKSFFDFS